MESMERLRNLRRVKKGEKIIIRGIKAPQVWELLESVNGSKVEFVAKQNIILDASSYSTRGFYHNVKDGIVDDGRKVIRDNRSWSKLRRGCNRLIGTDKVREVVLPGRTTELPLIHEGELSVSNFYEKGTSFFVMNKDDIDEILAEPEVAAKQVCEEWKDYFGDGHFFTTSATMLSEVMIPNRFFSGVNFGEAVKEFMVGNEMVIHNHHDRSREKSLVESHKDVYGANSQKRSHLKYEHFMKGIMRNKKISFFTLFGKGRIKTKVSYTFEANWYDRYGDYAVLVVKIKNLLGFEKEVVVFDNPTGKFIKYEKENEKMKLNDLLKQGNVLSKGFPAFRELTNLKEGLGEVVYLSTLSASTMLEDGINCYYAPVLPRGKVFHNKSEILAADLDVKKYVVSQYSSPAEELEGEKVIVSRHGETIKFLKEKYGNLPVFDGTVSPEDIKGKIVIGTLPSHLVVNCDAFTAVIIDNFDYTVDGDIKGEELAERIRIFHPITLEEVPC